jgi:hypothetical protein
MKIMYQSDVINHGTNGNGCWHENLVFSSFVTQNIEKLSFYSLINDSSIFWSLVKKFTSHFSSLPRTLVVEIKRAIIIKNDIH